MVQVLNYGPDEMRMVPPIKSLMGLNNDANWLNLNRTASRIRFDRWTPLGGIIQDWRRELLVGCVNMVIWSHS